MIKPIFLIGDWKKSKFFKTSLNKEVFGVLSLKVKVVVVVPFVYFAF